MARAPDPKGTAPAADSHAEADADRAPHHGPGPDIPQADPFLAPNDAGERAARADAARARAADRGAAEQVRPEDAARGPGTDDVARPAPAPNAPASPAAARGTTHDPNAVTTGTSAEPTHDVFPPKGER